MASPIVISILANASQANATLNSTVTTTQRVGNGFRQMALPAVAALGAIGLAAKQTIASASDLYESVSKNKQVFGAQAKEIEAFASRAEQALGQSKTAALEAASTFGILGGKAGLSGKDAAAFSKQFVTLASDLASFNNTSPEEAVVAIGAAMRGESEPIRKYGVLLDDATLRNRALKLGLIDNIKTALTPQQKALAASKEILAQTGKAQGDFARTADGAANKSRILAAQSENLKAKVGAGLLPVYVRLQTILASVIGFLGRHQRATKVVAAVVASLAAAVLLVNAAMAVGTAATATYNGVMIVSGAVQKATTAAALGTRIGLLALTIQTKATSLAAKAAAAAQWLLNAALTANPVGLIVLAIVGLVAAFILAYKNSETFRNIVQAALRSVLVAAQAIWAGIKVAFQVGVNAVLAAARLVRFYVGLYVAAFRMIVAAARAVISGVVAAFGNVVSFMRGVPGKIKGALSGAGSLLKGIGRSIIEGLVAGIKNATSLVTGAIGSVKNNVVSGLKNALKINSPSKIVMPMGSSITEGLAVGIRDGEKYVSTAINRVQRKVTNSDFGQANFAYGVDTKGKDAPSLTPVAVTGGNTTYEITVTAPVGASSADIGRDLVKHISAFEAAGGRRKA